MHFDVLLVCCNGMLECKEWRPRQIHFMNIFIAHRAAPTSERKTKVWITNQILIELNCVCIVNQAMTEFPISSYPWHDSKPVIQLFIINIRLMKIKEGTFNVSFGLLLIVVGGVYSNIHLIINRCKSHRTFEMDSRMPIYYGILAH